MTPHAALARGYVGRWGFYDVPRVPQGELLQYVHGGCDSVYEQDLLLVLEQGVPVERRR